MAQGGGRGWFRRRTHADAASPSETPSPTSMPPAAGAEASPAEASESEPRADGSPALAPIGSPTSSAPPAGADHAGQPPAPQTGGDAVDRASNHGAGSHPTPERPRPIDWDAATAAALNDDDAASTSTAPVRSPGTPPPDQFLEDLIREIVGDAAVDTVESLHQSTPGAPQAGGASTPSQDSEQNGQHQPAVLGTSQEAPSEPGLRPVAPPLAQASALQGAEAAQPSSAGQGAAIDERDISAAGGAGPSDPPSPPVVDAALIGGSGEPTREQESREAAGFTSSAAPKASAESAGVETASPVASEPSIRSDAQVPSDPAIEAGAPLPTAPQSPPHTTHEPDVSRETSTTFGGTPLADALADETRRRIALEEAVLPLPPKTRVLTISNQKGGVGKTTTAVNLAAALARSGAKVLVIDLDPQGNASTALGVDHRSEQRSVYEVLVSDLALAEVIRPSTEHERLDCVPATIHLAGAEIELVSLVAREQRLRRALDTHLASMERPYDYVFIDCPPSLGLLTINAFVAAREVLIPIQCEYYALEGLSQLLSNIELIEKHLNPELRLSTILLTMYDSRTNLAQQVAQEVRDHFPSQTLQTIIPRSVRVSEAPSYGQSVISYDFTSSGSLSYREAAAEIARRGAAKPDATSTKEHH